MIEKGSINITEDEAALYDRQIRLWGLDAQKRLRGSRVLLIGVGGLGAEVAKNIVLAGIKSLTLMDHVQVCKEDACSQFLIDRADLSKNRAEASVVRTQQLNSMVAVRTATQQVDDVDEEFFKAFDVVCATCCSLKQLVRINHICHRNQIIFYAGDVFGFYGYMFADLGTHHFAEEVTQKKKKQKKEKPASSSTNGEPPAKRSRADSGQRHQDKTDEAKDEAEEQQDADEETKVLKKMISFARLEQALSVDWADDAIAQTVKRTPATYFIIRVLQAFREEHGRDPSTASLQEDQEHLRSLKLSVMKELQLSPELVPEDFIQNCVAELSPVCAVVGGILGQEIIKAVSQKDAPHNNFFFYNGVDGSGMVDRIG